jgi:hypothetical protein
LAAAVTALDVGHPHNAQWAGHRPSPAAESVFRNSNNGLGRLPFAPAPFPSLQEQSKIHYLAHLDAARVVPGTPICDRAKPGASRFFFLPGSPRGHEMSLQWLRRHRSRWRRSQSILPPCHDMAASESLHALHCMHDTARACTCRHHVAELASSIFRTFGSVLLAQSAQTSRWPCRMQQAARPSHGLHPLWRDLDSMAVVTEAHTRRGTEACITALEADCRLTAIFGTAPTRPAEPVGDQGVCASSSITSPCANVWDAVPPHL